MSFIQCKDLNEVEKVIEGRPAAFFTEDFRVYEKIGLSDDALFCDLDPETVLELFNLQTEIERGADGLNEMSFIDLVDRANDLKKAFEKAFDAVNRNPIKKRRKAEK